MQMCIVHLAASLRAATEEKDFAETWNTLEHNSYMFVVPCQNQNIATQAVLFGTPGGAVSDTLATASICNTLYDYANCKKEKSSQTRTDGI